MVVRANRVVAASPAARADGVVPGQRRREAQGRCPSVTVVDHDEGRQARAFEAVAAALERVTPRIELSRPGVVAFPTRGPSRYFGGDEALAGLVGEAVEEVLAGRGWAGAAGVGVADGPFAAALAARSAAGTPAGVRVVEPGATPAFLAPLPGSRPSTGRSWATSSSAWACGPSGPSPPSPPPTWSPASAPPARPPTAWPGASTSGRPPRPRRRVTSGPSVELDPPAERVDVAAFVAKGLADEVHARLDREGLACTRVCIVAETEHGETLERLWRHEGALGAGALADRVRWQLDGWLNGSAAVRPTSGVTRLALVPDEVVPAQGRQLGFWGGEAAGADRAGRALARVQGLLGPGAVTVPERRGGRGPGEAVVRVPAAAVDLDGPRALPPTAEAPWPGRVPSPSPALVLGEPVAASVRDAAGAEVGVSGRGVLGAAPARWPSAGAMPPRSRRGPGPGRWTSGGGTRRAAAGVPASRCCSTTVGRCWCSSRAGAGGWRPSTTEPGAAARAAPTSPPPVSRRPRRPGARAPRPRRAPASPSSGWAGVAAAPRTPG